MIFPALATNQIDIDLEVKIQSLSLCDLILSIDSDKVIYESGEKIEIHNLLSYSKINFDIEYWIEDEDGTIIKPKKITSNLNKKSFTPKFEEKQKKIILKNRLVGCNGDNSHSEKIVIIENSDYVDDLDQKFNQSIKGKEELTSTKSNKNQDSYELLPELNGVTGYTLYESSSEKSKKLTPLVFIVVLILAFIVIFINKKP